MVITAKHNQQKSLIAMGIIASAHGLAGQVKIKSYTSPIDKIADYSRVLQDKSGQKYDFEIIGKAKNLLIVKFQNITNRNEAESLRNIELFINQSDLPQADDGEFYYQDLVGLDVQDLDGQVFAQVIAIDNYGAGDVLEIKITGTAKSQLLIFNQENVPEVNIAENYLVVKLPEIVNVG